MEPLAASETRTASGTGAGRDLARMRTPLSGASLSRAETALRKVTQDWALACNIKQLDDLVELYLPDATVLAAQCSGGAGHGGHPRIFLWIARRRHE